MIEVGERCKEIWRHVKASSSLASRACIYDEFRSKVRIGSTRVTFLSWKELTCNDNRLCHAVTSDDELLAAPRRYFSVIAVPVVVAKHRASIEKKNISHVIECDRERRGAAQKDD